MILIKFLVSGGIRNNKIACWIIEYVGLLNLFTWFELIIQGIFYLFLLSAGTPVSKHGLRRPSSGVQQKGCKEKMRFVVTPALDDSLPNTPVSERKTITGPILRKTDYQSPSGSHKKFSLGWENEHAFVLWTIWLKLRVQQNNFQSWCNFLIVLVFIVFIQISLMEPDVGAQGDGKRYLN